MKLFDVILKIIKTFALIGQDEHAQLTADVKEWESDATEQSKDKVKAIYAKMHKGPIIKLAMPFVYFIALKKVNELTNPSEDEDDLI